MRTFTKLSCKPRSLVMKDRDSTDFKHILAEWPKENHYKLWLSVIRKLNKYATIAFVLVLIIYMPTTKSTLTSCNIYSVWHYFSEYQLKGLMMI